MSVPVGLFSNPDCLSSRNADTPGAGDKGVSEPLQRSDLMGLQRLALLQFAVAFLQHILVDPFHLDLVEIEPQDPMDMSRSSALELHTIADVSHLHRVVLAKDHFFSEGLNPMLKIAGCEEDISFHHGMQVLIHMVPEVLLPWLLNSLLAILHLHCHILFAKLIHVVVNCAVLPLKLRSEVGAPSEVAGGEGEEDLKAVDQNIVECSMHHHQMKD